MKVEIEQVALSMSEAGISEEERRRVLTYLEQAQEEEDSERQPRVKKKHVILAVTTEQDQAILDAIQNTAMYVFMQPEEDDHNIVAADQTWTEVLSQYNDTKKGQRIRATSVPDLLENAPAKVFKSANIDRKTKEPTIVVINDGSFEAAQ